MSIGSSRLRRPVFTIMATTAILTGMLIAAPAASAAVLTQSLGPDLTATQLATALVGSGVTVSNAVFTGALAAGGTFSGGGTGAGGIIGFDQGVVLSTGLIGNVVGPNVTDNDASTNNGQPGDPFLDQILSDIPPGDQTTQDASVLTFNFVPDASVISFKYVFSSDEYNEYVGAGFNDIFAFLVNGNKCARPSEVCRCRWTRSTVRIPIGTGAINPLLYRNNSPNPGPATIDTKMDGITTVLTCTAAVTLNQTNTMRLSIGDVGDGVYDSNVFIEAWSLTTEPRGRRARSAHERDRDPGRWTEDRRQLDGARLRRRRRDPNGYTVICTATGNPDDVHSATVGGATLSAPISGLTNDVEYSCVVTAHNVNGNSDPSAASAPFTPTGSDAQFSMTIDTSQGGILLINPEGPANLGTTGKIKIPPQPGPATDVVVTASLFGIPGEADATCGGNVCIGQGIEWSVSNPSAIKQMRIKFMEAKKLTHGGSAQDAVAYKDGVPVPDCAPKVPGQPRGAPCIVWRFTNPHGGWQITFLVDGSDPKGRI